MAGGRSLQRRRWTNKFIDFDEPKRAEEKKNMFFENPEGKWTQKGMS